MVGHLVCVDRHAVATAADVRLSVVPPRRFAGEPCLLRHRIFRDCLVRFRVGNSRRYVQRHQSPSDCRQPRNGLLLVPRRRDQHGDDGFVHWKRGSPVGSVLGVHRWWSDWPVRRVGMEHAIVRAGGSVVGTADHDVLLHHQSFIGAIPWSFAGGHIRIRFCHHGDRHSTTE